MKLHSPHPILYNVHTPKTMPAESQEVTNPQQATPWLSDHSQNTREFVLGIEHKLAFCRICHLVTVRPVTGIVMHGLQWPGK